MPRTRLTRRALVAGAAAATVLRTVPATAQEACVDADDAPQTHRRGAIPLGDIDDYVAWGVAIASPAVSDRRLVEALRDEAPRFLAIANGLKFDYLYPQRKDIERIDGHSGAHWGECDAVVALARRLDVPVRGDCLAWNDWLPPWLKQLAADRPEGWTTLTKRAFEGHFADVFAHFATSDVPMRWCGLVNEPFNPWVRAHGVAAWRTGAWLDAFGIAPDGVPAYIHKAFELGARFGGKDTTLFLNEAHTENDKFGPLMRPAMLKLVDCLQHAGRRIDAVGLECHLIPQWMDDPQKPDFAAFGTFLRELARRGVRILITELDVLDCAARTVRARDRLVADTMYALVSTALAVPAVEMVTSWDLSDKYSWLRSAPVYPQLDHWADCSAQPECPRPDIYDADMRPKTARESLAAALAAGRR